MNWYLQSGKESDVVTSTRIRFARNLPEFKFNLKNKNEIENIWKIGNSQHAKKIVKYQRSLKINALCSISHSKL